MNHQKTNEYVTQVIDGDSFATNTRAPEVRLEGIDTPEAGEFGYQAAKNALSGLILNKHVAIETNAHDIYGRRIAQVWVNGWNVSTAMKSYSK